MNVRRLRWPALVLGLSAGLASQASAQSVQVVEVADSALLIGVVPPCSTACPDSVRLEWRYGGQYIIRKVRQRTVDTVKVRRNATNSAYVDSARVLFTLFAKTPSMVAAAGFVRPIAAATAVATGNAATPPASNNPARTSGSSATPAGTSEPPPVPPPTATERMSANGLTPSRVTMPRVFLDTMVSSARNARPGRTIAVLTFAALQAAVDSARGGDVITLRAGITYAGTLILRRKPAATGWIVIRSAGTLPSPGTRYRPSPKSPLPRLVAKSGNDAAIQTEAGAHHYHLLGLEVAPPDEATAGSALVALGNSGAAQATVESQPSHLVLDRMYVHGTPKFGFRRCVLLNTGAVAVVDSWLSECHGKGFDSQAILAYNGSGPFKIQNNYLEGAGENVMFGGSDASAAALLPADIEIRGNYFYKPLDWRGVWSVKNLLEFKVGIRALIEGNVFENCWVDGQTGWGVLLKTVNQNRSAPWSETRDITFRGNIVRNTVGGVALAALPERGGGVPMSRVAILDNWFDTIGDGPVVATTSVSYVYIERNTGLDGRGALRFNSGAPADSVVIRSNIFGATRRPADAVISGDAVAVGTPAMQKFARTWLVQQNVFVGASSKIFPTGNYYPRSVDAVGFAGGAVDPSLRAGTPYAAARVGAPIRRLQIMQRSVTTGAP